MPPSGPIPPTIIFLSLPTSLLLGLDTLAISPSAKFLGLTLIPPGWHLLYAGATASLSARSGYWLHIPERSELLTQSTEGEGGDSSEGGGRPWLRVFAWDTETETLCTVGAPKTLEMWRKRLEDEDDRELRGGLLPYGVDRTKLARAQAPREMDSKPTMRREEAETRGGLITIENDAGPSSGEEPAREDVDFGLLTAHVSTELLTNLTGCDERDENWAVGTTSCAVEDRDEIPGLVKGDRRFTRGAFEAEGARRDADDDDDDYDRKDGREIAVEERELRFFGIDLKKTWRDGAVGEERTTQARDRSWALENLIDREERSQNESQPGKHGERRDRRDQDRGAGEYEQDWGHLILGELEVTFIMVLLLSNYSCLSQWKRILALVLTCQSAIPLHSSFFATFLRLLTRQLQRCGDVEGGLFDVRGEEAGWLKGLLRGFRRILEDGELVKGEGVGRVRAEMKVLEKWVEGAWGWEMGDEFVRRGMVDLEDGERVEVEMDDMEGEDERGEYAPVVVEL